MKQVVFCVAALFVAGCTFVAPSSDEAPAAAGETPVQGGVYVFDSEPAATVPCVMMLDDNAVDDAPGFHNVWLGSGCESNFPILAVLSGWEEMEGGGVRLIGAEGSTFAEFARGEDGRLRGVSENDGHTYTMQMGE